MRQSVKRLRTLLAEAAIPIEIEATDRGYQLVAGKDAPLLRYRNLDSQNVTGPSTQSYQPLLDGFAGQEFSKREIMDKFSMPERSASRWLQAAVEADILDKVGAGRSTRYKIRGSHEE